MRKSHPLFGDRRRGKKRSWRKDTSGLEVIPDGAMMIPTETKRKYDQVPFHVYHPTPFDAITILRKKNQEHEWLVCGWYIDTYKEEGAVKGLIYRAVRTDDDKKVVISELKKHDKEAIPRFSLEER